VATASISETKAKLSALIDRVLFGETVTITDRGVPVARIVPLGTSTNGEWDARLEGLERSGVVVRPTQVLDVDAFLAGSRVDTRASVVDALLDERRTSTR
jgi:prevent-host-death family protein